MPDLDERVAFELAEIFQYDIDFVLDIQSGDRFTVVYEEVFQDGERLRTGNILAAKFINEGREYRAVRYVDDKGHGEYFTPDGRSLRKAFIRAPVQFSRISSRFNPSRRHPVLNTIRAHRGVDYAAPVGTPVRAAGEGRVRFVGRQGGYGNVIELEHGSGVVTVYGHLSRFAAQMRRGQRVELGKVIGYVGKTGLATGPHLHYEYRDSRRAQESRRPCRFRTPRPSRRNSGTASSPPRPTWSMSSTCRLDRFWSLADPRGAIFTFPGAALWSHRTSENTRPWTCPISVPQRTTSIASFRCSHSMSGYSHRHWTKKSRCSSG